ncbi:MAG: radical SAM protein [Bacteroidales bacterium]
MDNQIYTLYFFSFLVSFSSQNYYLGTQLMKSRFEKYANLILPAWQGYNRIKSNLISYPASNADFTALDKKSMRAYNSIRYHGAKSMFCYNPFVNLFFDTDGKAVACCRSHDYILGTYPEQNISDIWFGKKAEKMREYLRHNDLSMGCAYCENQVHSGRFQGLPSMHADKYAHSKSGMFPKIMELELSNRCNLECLMCSGRESSKIRENRENKPPLKQMYDAEFVHQLESFIPHLKEMHFYGGEPFLIEIYYDIWEAVKRIKPQLQLHAVTNGTVLNHRIENLMKALRFRLSVSLDSLNKENFENIRKGADFDQVMRNTDKFAELSSDSLVISHTPITLNKTETAAIVRFCNDHDYRLNLSFVEQPAAYAIWALMPEELNELLDLYEKDAADLKNTTLAARYNNKLFREWIEQVRFFRNRNRDILNKADEELPDQESLMIQLKAILEEASSMQVVKLNPESVFNAVQEEMAAAGHSVIARNALKSMLDSYNNAGNAKLVELGHITREDVREIVTNMLHPYDFFENRV